MFVRVSFLTSALGCAAIVCAGALQGVEPQKPARTPLRASGGKLTAPIEIGYRFDGRPAAGERVGLDLSLQPTLDLTGLQVQINCDEGLQCSPGTSGLERSFGARAAGVAVSERIDVVPLEEGRHYVHVVARVLVGDRAFARTVAIPVQVGEETLLKAAGSVATDAQGRRLVVLPATD
jgi:hypothetical protein